jgi:cytochrome c biogenesis protein CcmG, thiol:disulfide interchange protein DsbE
MRRRGVLFVGGVVVLAVVLVVGLRQASSGNGSEKLPAFDLAQAKRSLSAAPAPLNGVYTQANELIGGGTSAFDQRLATLKGHPVVINKWASWCGPCQAEIPIFQNVAGQRGKQVAFLGLDANDKDPAARGFLAKKPLPYPSYTDPKEKITASLKMPVGPVPITIFIGANGSTQFIHTGQYQTAKQLNTDIDRYLH